MGLWKTRTYTCKNKDCKKSVEVTPEDVLSCDSCGTPLVGSRKPQAFMIGVNPMARTTKMEFSTQSYDDSYKDFRK
jgi:hypothetical protein